MLPALVDAEAEAEAEADAEAEALEDAADDVQPPSTHTAKTAVRTKAKTFRAKAMAASFL